jgi:tRNA wybutosine-synthesizing protein 1
MLTAQAKNELEKQQYRIVGTHSAVKTCGWTKNMIRGEGGCYKLKFYGIMSHQCMQMTTSMSCANRCSFCWRGYKAPVSKDWVGKVDDPDFIFDGSVEAHHKLLVGFKGSDKANKAVYENSTTVKHVALSLTGEPIMYPRMNELLDRFNKEGVSTFLVTNAQYPQQIKDLKPVTQLYLSIDAPNRELLKEIDKPLFSDFWERSLESLDHLREKRDRTCIRLTVIKKLNDVLPEQYAELIKRGSPDFIEAKGYMHVGASQQRLTRENMPFHEEVVAFSKKLVKFLPDYEIASEHIPSRVVMFAKKKFKINASADSKEIGSKETGTWHTWIDFKKWHQLVNSGKEFAVEDFLARTPQPGLSGKGTLDTVSDEVRERIKDKCFVDEETEEIAFYTEEEKNK